MIRYSHEELLFLRDSPLVSTPQGLPSIDDLYNNPQKKRPDDPLLIKTADKLFLGPPKSNFPSSQASSFSVKSDDKLKDSKDPRSFKQYNSPRDQTKQPYKPPGRKNFKDSDSEDKEPLKDEKKSTRDKKPIDSVKDVKESEPVPLHSNSGRNSNNSGQNNYGKPSYKSLEPEWMTDVKPPTSLSSKPADQLDEMQKFRLKMKKEQGLLNPSTAPSTRDDTVNETSTNNMTTKDATPISTPVNPTEKTFDPITGIESNNIDDMFLSESVIIPKKETKSKFTQFFNIDTTATTTPNTTTASVSSPKKSVPPGLNSPLKHSPSLKYSTSVKSSPGVKPKVLAPRPPPAETDQFIGIGGDVKVPVIGDVGNEEKLEQKKDEISGGGVVTNSAVTDLSGRKPLSEDEVIKSLGIQRQETVNHANDDFNRILNMLSRSSVSTNQNPISPPIPPPTQQKSSGIPPQQQPITNAPTNNNAPQFPSNPPVGNFPSPTAQNGIIPSPAYGQQPQTQPPVNFPSPQQQTTGLGQLPIPQSQQQGSQGPQQQMMNNYTQQPNLPPIFNQPELLKEQRLNLGPGIVTPGGNVQGRDGREVQPGFSSSGMLQNSGQGVQRPGVQGVQGMGVQGMGGGLQGVQQQQQSGQQRVSAMDTSSQIMAMLQNSINKKKEGKLENIGMYDKYNGPAQAPSPQFQYNELRANPSAHPGQFIHNNGIPQQQQIHEFIQPRIPLGPQHPHPQPPHGITQMGPPMNGLSLQQINELQRQELMHLQLLQQQAQQQLQLQQQVQRGRGGGMGMGNARMGGVGGEFGVMFNPNIPPHLQLQMLQQAQQQQQQQQMQMQQQQQQMGMGRGVYRM